jgi:hypothetical protein
MDLTNMRRRNADNDMSTTSIALLATALAAIMTSLGIAVYLSG